MNKRATLSIAFAVVGILIGLIVMPIPWVVGLLALAGVGLGLIFPLAKTAGAGIHLGFADYAWRLIPANPILLRVVESGGKRRRDLIIRCAYLGLLVFVVIFSLMQTSGSVGGGSSLSELAKQSAQIFQTMSYLQLGLVALLAPIFTAGAITQEKDSQTYDILLATPLTNGQIVLGSLLSRLFFVVALLVSGIPIFSITQIFGGVAISSIVKSFGIAAATAFVTGALAMAIAVFKVGTRRTIFSFYLFVVIYLVGGYLLDGLPFFHYTLADGSLSTTSWLTGIHPFLALEVIFNKPAYTPPGLLDLPEGLRRWPLGTYLSKPDQFYTSFMFLLSFLLVTPSIVLLRRLAQSSTSLKTALLQKLGISRGDRNRKPRYVWANPIAWREARTKASAARATFMRYGFMIAGLFGALWLAWGFATLIEPKQFLESASYDERAGTLAVYSRTAEPVNLRLPLDAIVTYQGQRTTIDKLRGRLAVVAEPKTITTPNGRTQKVWASITATDIQRKWKPAEVRQFLLGMVIVEFAVILLIVTNAAASTVTREKEDGTLDILLTSPITSRYYIWGKLRGLVSFVLPLIMVPVVSAFIFVVYDLFRRVNFWDDPAFNWIVLPEALILMPAMLIIVAAFGAIVGMQMSLRCRTTVVAVMSSVGIVVGLCAALGWCGYSVLGNNGNEMGLVLGSFSPFTMLMLQIDPYTFAGSLFGTGPDAEDTFNSRMLMFMFTLVAVAAYTAVVWSMYRSMVKNFDMTIRRQSR